ncbi:hypothetical protein D3C76_1339970 [compost metagenome]
MVELAESQWWFVVGRAALLQAKRHPYFRLLLLEPERHGWWYRGCEDRRLEIQLRLFAQGQPVPEGLCHPAGFQRRRFSDQPRR